MKRGALRGQGPSSPARPAAPKVISVLRTRQGAECETDQPVDLIPELLYALLFEKGLRLVVFRIDLGKNAFDEMLQTRLEELEMVFLLVDDPLRQAHVLRQERSELVSSGGSSALKVTHAKVLDLVVRRGQPVAHSGQ